MPPRKTRAKAASTVKTAETEKPKPRQRTRKATDPPSTPVNTSHVPEGAVVHSSRPEPPIPRDDDLPAPRGRGRKRIVKSAAVVDSDTEGDSKQQPMAMEEAVPVDAPVDNEDSDEPIYIKTRKTSAIADEVKRTPLKPAVRVNTRTRTRQLEAAEDEDLDEEEVVKVSSKTSDISGSEGEVDYRGVDLDGDASDFIDDEAVEDDEAVDSDDAIEEDQAVEKDDQEDEGETTEPVSDVDTAVGVKTRTNLRRRVVNLDSDDEDQLPVIRKPLYSPDWDPISTPQTPVKTTKSLLLESPGTPSPRKKTISSTKSKSKRRASDQSEHESSSLAPSPTKKKLRFESPLETPSAEDVFIRQMEDFIAKSVKSGSDSAKLALLAATLEDVKKISSAASSSHLESEDEDQVKVEEAVPDVPVTPKKNRHNDEKDQAILPLTPRSKLAADIGNKLSFDEILRINSTQLDSSLDYHNLITLEAHSNWAVSLAKLLFTPHVLNVHSFSEKQRTKLTCLFQQPVLGRGKEIHNLARQDPGIFRVAQTVGSFGSPYYFLQEATDRGIKPCAFVTFLEVVESNLTAVRPIKTNARIGNKSLQGFPFNVEIDREFSAAKSVFEHFFVPDQWHKSIDEITNMTIRVFSNAITFQTEMDRLASGNVPTGAVVQGTSIPFSAENKKRWYHDCFLNDIKRPFLGSASPVPIFDATDIFQGGHPDVHFDLTNMAEVCKFSEKEIAPKSFVAVIHSVVRGTVTEQTNLLFGIYTVVILASPNYKYKMS